MKKRNHIWLGLLFVMLLVLIMGWIGLNVIVFTISSVFLLIFISIFYSLLPDIDHKNSTITWWFFGIGLLGLSSGVLELVGDFGLFNPIPVIVISTLLLIVTFVSVNFFEHRGFTHSIPAGILAVLPLYFVFHNPAYCILAYAAWHSHLIGDGYLFKLK